MANEAKHSPGPWAISDETFIWTVVNDPGETSYDLGTPVAEVCRLKSFAGPAYSSDEVAANAHLIAAAPDMYEALRTTSANIRSLGPAGALDDVPMPYREWLKVVEDALSKAEGRS